MKTKAHFLAGHGFLILFALFFSLPAMTAPFWTGNDSWSNLLPIIHVRDSILTHHTFPAYTDLWYGGRFQWQNPLWSFLYLPATIIWLLMPLDWGIRIVFFAHLIFILFAARKLASIFFDHEIEKVSAAILLASPILPAFIAGQNEKILSWGWVLLIFFFFLDGRNTPRQQGLLAGICLGIVPLTGSNYYVFYAGILLAVMAVLHNDKKSIPYLLVGHQSDLRTFPVSGT